MSPESLTERILDILEKDRVFGAYWDDFESSSFGVYTGPLHEDWNNMQCDQDEFKPESISKENKRYLTNLITQEIENYVKQFGRISRENLRHSEK